MEPGASKNRLSYVLNIGREYLTHWAIAGAIIALTGFAPEHWVADLFSHLAIPESLRGGWLLRAFDFRIAFVAVGVAIIAWDVLRRSGIQKQAALRDSEVEASHLVLPDRPSIAVLPFQNMSGETEQEYFADGITDDIITDLSKIAGLLVIARNSSFAYKGKSVDIRTIGRELGVRSVLEGSIRRVNNRVRITAQLINAADSAHLWAERYDRDLTDIFAVQDEVTHHIIDALKIKLTPGEAARIADIPTKSLEAHDLFLRGREILYGQKWNREIFDTVVALLRGAIELDPNYAEAYAGLGWAHLYDFHNHLTGSPDALDVAEHFANLAVEKGPKVPFAHWLAAAAAGWKRNPERAKSETEIALTLNPNDALAYATRGTTEIYSGNPLAAIPFLERAIRLDPVHTQQYIHFLGSAYLVACNYEAAVTSFRERIRLAPETDLSRGLLVSALGHLGEIDEARRIWAELKQVNPKYSFAGHLARLPFSNPADAARIKDDFAKAGLSN
jgi:adenylate cyclase